MKSNPTDKGKRTVPLARLDLAQRKEVIMQDSIEQDSIENRRVAESSLRNGKWVSTVRQFGCEIYESIVFDSRYWTVEYEKRIYSTREQAESGHWELVNKWS